MQCFCWEKTATMTHRLKELKVLATYAGRKLTGVELEGVEPGLKVKYKA